MLSVEIAFKNNHCFYYISSKYEEQVIFKYKNKLSYCMSDSENCEVLFIPTI